MEVNCVACGHRFDLGDSYDDYEGPVRCCVCHTLLRIRTEDGNLRFVEQVRPNIRPAPTSDPNASQEGTKP
ncbi:MAG: hypothetical protein ACOC8E_04160 [Planctomycetota bacterium]